MISAAATVQDIPWPSGGRTRRSRHLRRSRKVRPTSPISDTAQSAVVRGGTLVTMNAAKKVSESDDQGVVHVDMPIGGPVARGRAGRLGGRLRVP